MTFQSMLGLIYDPIGNRVEAPCLGKNVMSASNALACANMALAGYDQVIPLDEVIETAQHVAARCRENCAARRWAGCPSPRPRWPSRRSWRRRSQPRAARRAVGAVVKCLLEQFVHELKTSGVCPE